MTSILFEQMVIVLMGCLISFSSKKYKIYPIPVLTELLGIVIAIGIVWLIHHIDDSWFSMSFGEQCKFLLLGFVPMRVVGWVCRKKEKKAEGR